MKKHTVTTASGTYSLVGSRPTPVSFVVAIEQPTGDTLWLMGSPYGGSVRLYTKDPATGDSRSNLGVRCDDAPTIAKVGDLMAFAKARFCK